MLFFTGMFENVLKSIAMRVYVYAREHNNDTHKDYNHHIQIIL